MTDVTDGKLSDIIPDANNANLGTERGRAALESSLRKHGAGRSILLDHAGRIISGNKTVEEAGQLGLDELIIVKTDGTKLVAVQREDLDLADDSTGARELAYADNRVGELDLSWNPETILADLDSGVDLGGLFREDELDRILGTVVDDPNGEWGGMPEFEQEDSFEAIATVKVHFVSTDDIQEFARLVGQTVTEKSTFIWFPKKERMDLTQYQVSNES